MFMHKLYQWKKKTCSAEINSYIIQVSLQMGAHCLLSFHLGVLSVKKNNLGPPEREDGLASK